MIEDLGRHMSKKFTCEEKVVDKALRSPFFDDLEEIGGVYEIKEFMWTVKRPYPCGIAMFQLGKFGVLESYYDFLKEYFSRQDFELCYIDTDSLYLAMSDDSLDKIVKPEMRQAYQVDKKNWLAADEYSERTPG